VLLIAAANQVALVLLLEALTVDKVSHGASLLIATLQVWLTNIIIFGLAFWEMDRGGAVARTQQSRAELAAADFRFPQDEDADAVREVRMRSSEKSDWVPSFLDYLYVSVTNSTAFERESQDGASATRSSSFGSFGGAEPVTADRAPLLQLWDGGFMERTRDRTVKGIEMMPIYLIAGDSPQEVTTDQYISTVPMLELLKQLGPGDHLYLVDYAGWTDGSIKLILLA